MDDMRLHIGTQGGRTHLTYSTLLTTAGAGAAKEPPLACRLPPVPCSNFMPVDGARHLYLQFFGN